MGRPLGDPDSRLMEPNGREAKQEFCVVADWLEAMTRSVTVPHYSGNVTAWGWNDQDCNRNYPFICKKLPRR
jgi:hypothetical protein